MKKYLITALLAMFALTNVSFGMMSKVYVFKMTIKASNTVFDVNDTNHFTPLLVKGYCVINADPIIMSPYKSVTDSNCVIYDKKREWVKMFPDCFTMDPCDPCMTELLSFYAFDADGYFSFDVTGKGKLTHDTNDTTKTYVVKTWKGNGLVRNFDFFAPDETYTGPVTVTLTLDPGVTIKANARALNVDQTLNEIIDVIIMKDGGTWLNWPYEPPGA